MHLYRSRIHIFFVVLQIINSTLCDDGSPEATYSFQNETKISNIFDTSLSNSSQRVLLKKRESVPNGALPVSEGVNLMTVKPLTVSKDDQIESIKAMNSSSEISTTVKKQLPDPVLINVTKLASNNSSNSNDQTNMHNETIQNIKTIPLDITKVFNASGIHEVGATNNGENTTVSVDDGELPKNGAKKRALIVFGSLGLFTFFYVIYKIYRKKKQIRENDNSFYMTDNQQFKYGVLLSNENDDNLELSNLPLSVDSEDEEMEIFDIEQKKFLDNNMRQEYRFNSRLSEKDDIEILDLDLPGTSSSLLVTNDDNLLNLDDVNQHDVSVIHHNVTNGSKPNNANEFFDVL